MTIRRKNPHMAASFLAACLATTAMTPALAAAAAPMGEAAVQEFSIAAQPLQSALLEFSRQSQSPVVASTALLQGLTAPAVVGRMGESDALNAMLAGSDLYAARSPDGGWAISRRAETGPQSGSAAGDGAEVEALIVTAQKREEDIQDVPIAISAFTQEQLERSQVAGGPDLITQVPNMTFTKTNFSSYSIQLRGIGTQAISATVDPAVAVAFNNTPFIRNRFFEQEFYDLQRIEVLRGPQGTLYGRNATAGVVNLLSQKAKLDTYEAKLSGDLANYNSMRVEGMVNIPLANDVVGLRIAGAWTKREGYSVNALTGNSIDGRDLWSTRVSLRFAPTDRLDANLIWEHFEEDDDRLRSGKQLCHMDVPTEVAGFAKPDFYALIPDYGVVGGNYFAGIQANFSQGCAPASLYAPESFEKTNPLALPYFLPLGAVGLPIARDPNNANLPIDPYTSRTQSTDLRVIEAAVDPGYRAKTDVLELQFAYDLSDSLTLNSETAWGSDFIFSTQDYNRFASSPGAFDGSDAAYTARAVLSEDGIFCDPQIGCSDRLVAMDLSTARSRQFSQELRLASDFDGPLNFSLGGNYLRYDTEDKYYVFINTLSMVSAYTTRGQVPQFPDPAQYVPGVTDNRYCLPNGLEGPDYSRAQPLLQCTYLDPNPITSLNDLGHNYFLSKNPYKLISYAVFGEAYYQVADNLKVTAGLRWTVDKKEAPLVPSWLLASFSVGYPIVETVRQEWSEPTGRLAIDWKPDLPLTDETMVYGSYAHGYKAGGMNPPPYGKTLTLANIADFGELLAAQSTLHPKTFEPEFVDAFELGSKNTLLDGAITLNLAAFYYDYKGYQLSQIIDRSAVTDNFDADVWGVEMESDWRAAENLRFGLKLGYERTKVADGTRAIDVMDRTAGQPGWLLMRPFPTVPSNCVMPEWLLLGNPNGIGGETANPGLVNVGGKSGGGAGGCELAYVLQRDPGTSEPFQLFPYQNGLEIGAFNPGRLNVDYASWSTDRADYPCLPAGADPATMTEYPGVDPQCLAALSNNGEGFAKDLSGNELPNAPHMTATLTADYTVPLPSEWLMTLHTDLYYQSESWTRIFNTEGYDKLKAYTNVNLAAIFTNEDAGWKVMAFIKNVFDRDSITGAFLNSDDTGLTTNIFLTEPRLYGLRVTKEFQGGPWWTGANLGHEGPFPLTVELSGQVQRHDAPSEGLRPAWVDALPAAVSLNQVEGQDLDWGDGRSVAVTYRPEGSPWHAGASVRYGRTNSETSRNIAVAHDLRHECSFPSDSFFSLLCDPDLIFYGHSYYSAALSNLDVSNWADAEARGREEHKIIAFEVGRDVGLGGAAASTVSAELRYADFTSDDTLLSEARTDWVVPEDGWGCAKYQPTCASSYTERHASETARRSFKGWGPAASWDGGLPIWGGAASGRLNIDWSVAGGVLFGNRKATLTGQDVTTLHKGALAGTTTQIGDRSMPTQPLPVIDTATTPMNFDRSEEATVPLLDLSLGLSYDVGRIKVSTGYRWERYFDVLDVGVEEAENGDRTIDGPYFKIAIGFGG